MTPHEPPNAAPIRFLIVDDLEENLGALEGLLRRDGLEILKARSGREALEILLVHDIALAFLDVQMPGMDGFEVAELMRGSPRTRSIPIIFVTAGGRDQQRLFRGYEAGAVDFLFKPIEPAVLQSKANVFYELYRQRQEVARLLEESKRAERVVRASGQQFRTMADAMPQLVWTTRPDGFHDFYNRRWYEYTGMTAQESQGSGWQKAFHEEDLKLALPAWQHSLRTGDPYEVEYRCRRRDGEWRWFLGRAQPLHDENGAITRWFGTCTDVHEQKQLAEFEQQLIGIVSHDLKGPLQAILFTAQRLLRHGELDEKTLTALTRIVASTQRGTRLINDLLDLTRVRLGGGIPLTREPTNLHQLIAGVVQELESAHPDRELKLQHVGVAQGEWDSDRLAQVASNLIGNALKYGAQDRPVCVDTLSQESVALFRVHNFGAAIPREKLSRIFEPFHRGRIEPEGAYRSIGLGLYISNHIVQRHGGEIEVRSSEDAGTTVTVRLPISQATPVQPQ